ncbi:MAG: NAD(P)/FAD-dependent oxidoreductase [Spirochaetales bacterium]|nr:NAD(P)/FAD-dependent oxidoreductase [Spirochaetales bacterium]
MSTLLLEQHNLPGEYATSFVRGRFEFETSLHELPDMRSQKDTIDVIDYLLDDAGLDIEFIPIPEAYRVILPDEKVDVTVPFGIDNFIDTVSREVPGSRKTISDYINLCREINEGFKYLGENRGNISYRRFFKEHGNFIRTSARTMEETADALGLTEKIKNIIYPYWCYLGVPENRLSFSIWASMLYAYISSGAAIPKLRSHEIAAAFINKIEESGGTVQLNTEVKKILVKGNSIYGIETRDGKTIMAKSIISNASPTLIFNSLIHPAEAVPAQALRNIRTRSHGLSLVVVYLGLNADRKKLGLNEYSYFIAPYMRTDELYKSLYNINSKEIMQASICLNAANPDCSPPGTTILSITAGFRPEPWESIIPRALSVEDENYINGLEFCGGFSYRAHGYGSSILSGKDAFVSSLKHLKSAGAEK